MPSTGAPPQANEGNTSSEIVEGRWVTPRRTSAPDLGWSTSWWVLTWGFVDHAASRCYLSRLHAEKLCLDLEKLDKDISSSIVEMTNRPRGVRELHGRVHRSSFNGLGVTPLCVNLVLPRNPPRYVIVKFVVFGNGQLPRGSTVDFVVTAALAQQLPSWMRDTARSDAVSRAFSRGLPPVIPYVLPSASAKDGGGETARPPSYIVPASELGNPAEVVGLSAQSRHPHPFPCDAVPGATVGSPLTRQLRVSQRYTRGASDWANRLVRLYG